MNHDPHNILRTVADVRCIYSDGARNISPVAIDETHVTFRAVEDFANATNERMDIKTFLAKHTLIQP